MTLQVTILAVGLPSSGNTRLLRTEFSYALGVDNDLIFDADRRPKLYFNVFHPELDDLFAVGLIQANDSIWRVADDQSKLGASFLIAAAEGHERASWFRALKAHGPQRAAQGSYVQTERHRLEANYYAYRRQARRLLRGFGAMAKAELKSWRLPKACWAGTPVSCTCTTQIESTLNERYPGTRLTDRLSKPRLALMIFALQPCF